MVGCLTLGRKTGYCWKVLWTLATCQTVTFFICKESRMLQVLLASPSVSNLSRAEEGGSFLIAVYHICLVADPVPLPL